MSIQNTEVQYDVVNGKIVEVTPDMIKNVGIRVTEVGVLKSKLTSCKRRAYQLRGTEAVLNVAGENSRQTRSVLDILIDQLEGIVNFGLVKLEYEYSRAAINVPTADISRYRNASPVIKINTSVKLVEGDYLLTIKLHELKGHVEEATIRSFKPELEMVISGLRTASRRLIGSK